MSITLNIELASGQSLKDVPLELLRDGVVIGRAKLAETGKVVFDAAPGAGQLAVRVDRTILGGK
ncbi:MULTISPECIES: hypothetical protein [Pseudomonas]|uniref:Uncharacterized protein n=1 Tax=Pseudomonas donghuensis TaxID=1163398 RepID=A0AAP0XCE5_9PSED|nr:MULTISPECIES: hypothetical protein [Pseudomonas]MDF9891876.1 hypothetical protein [Pseudomonas vranovensis]KDO01347.1 hypothetical protein BV82_0302 [Pseudomonas donghuensis]MBF4208822.1 hypothetical protein [Pseudomonas donghuensis]MBS7599548.1 hypothetical protein [Pseudomonas sp. RC2C2]MCP6691418.1 hypothetical protein [Pseudomonas donghuensis]